MSVDTKRVPKKLDLIRAERDSRPLHRVGSVARAPGLVEDAREAPISAMHETDTLARQHDSWSKNAIPRVWR